MTYYSSNCPQTFTETPAGLTGNLVQPVAKWFHLLQLKAQVQRERKQLAAMSFEQLRDIGIDRIDATTEAARRDLPARRKALVLG